MTTDYSIEDVRDRAKAAFIGLAVGDALGATVEFMKPGEIAFQYGIHRDIIGNGWLRLNLAGSPTIRRCRFASHAQ
jgi:ADP-ribosyl-[dinitrogen reductase] hydrolase